MYFAGKLVYLIVRASNKLAVIIHRIFNRQGLELQTDSNNLTAQSDFYTW